MKLSAVEYFSKVDFTSTDRHRRRSRRLVSWLTERTNAANAFLVTSRSAQARTYLVKHMPMMSDAELTYFGVQRDQLRD